MDKVLSGERTGLIGLGVMDLSPAEGKILSKSKRHFTADSLS